jgi:hypothetical protein
VEAFRDSQRGVESLLFLTFRLKHKARGKKPSARRQRHDRLQRTKSIGEFKPAFVSRWRKSEEQNQIRKNSGKEEFWSFLAEISKGAQCRAKKSGS